MLFLFILLAAGLYPALRLQSRPPIQIVQNARFSSRLCKRLSMRSFLVVCQFIGSIVLIICSLFIPKQLHYVKNQNPGFKRDNMIVIPTQTQKMAQQLQSDLETIKHKFLQYHNVISATAHLASPGREWRMDWPTLVETNFSPGFPFTWEFVDFDYINTYELDLLYGQNFNEENETDRGTSFILNETAAIGLEFQSPQEAIGKHISTWMGEAEIVGIIKDFHYQSLHKKIDPLMLSIMPTFFPEAVTLKLGASDISETLVFLKNQWSEVFPDFPFEYYFVDKDFISNYDADEQFAMLIYIFSALAIFVACLGLFGLASLSAVKRTKEIGIRKVLGATTPKLLYLLNREFIVLVFSACLIASPIAIYALIRWLQNFAYRTAITIWPFVAAFLAALAIALITVSVQAVKTAAANPVEALRYE